MKRCKGCKVCNGVERGRGREEGEGTGSKGKGNEGEGVQGQVLKRVRG